MDCDPEYETLSGLSRKASDGATIAGILVQTVSLSDFQEDVI